MCASHWVLFRPRGAMKVKDAPVGRTNGPARPVRHIGGTEREHTRWNPKDGELCLGRTRPEETLVEVRSDSDVQIDCQTLV
ncbi:uncharacterized protein LOC111626996 [Centruroides sculpturatus]|uniref:uncharacterized protein LOC111626996 n=1 Tax=Centruroides sculpturatus TaxID=218467 RepID=UPI000C6E241E|nr:uncharacterized protein LOC111626996 [Centruroides sculpturatus]